MKALDEIRGRHQYATEGPWTVDISGNRKWALVQRDEWVVARVSDDDTAEFIANAPTDVARLLNAVEAALDLHEPVDAAMYSGSQAHKVQVCAGCGQDDGNWQRWPCPTVQAITSALEAGR